MLPSDKATTTRIRKLPWKLSLDNGTVVVVLRPGVDWYTVGEMTEVLREMRPSWRVVIDCRDVHIDHVAAIGWLVSVHRWCTARSLTMTLRGLDIHEEERLRRSGLQRLVEHPEDRPTEVVRAG